MNTTLDVKSLENWLWEAACKIRGPVDAPKYKNYILPLHVPEAPLRRLRRRSQENRAGYRRQGAGLE